MRYRGRELGRLREPVLENLITTTIRQIQGTGRREDERGPANRSLNGETTFENEDRMSPVIALFRSLGIVLILSLSFVLAGCTGDMDDPGAKRTQLQAEELRDRINTTQIDR